MTGWLEHKAELTSMVRQIEPQAVLISKRHWIFVPSAWFLFIVSFGKFKRDVFYDRMATAFGPLIGLPETLDFQSAREIILHEGRHARQTRWLGFGISPWLGLPLLALLYIFLPFPVLIAFFRYWMELDADAYMWKELLRKRLWTEAQVRKEAERRARSLASVDYFWAVPLKVSFKGYTERAELVILQARGEGNG